MIDASRYDKIEKLKNGTTVRIRSIRPDDKNRIAEAFRNLESESIYTRFFVHKKALTDEELKAATELARLWRGQGKVAEARGLLEPVVEWFTEGLDTAPLLEARALLDELGSA